MADKHVVKRSSTKIWEVTFAVGDPAVKSASSQDVKRKSEIDVLYCTVKNK